MNAPDRTPPEDYGHPQGVPTLEEVVWILFVLSALGFLFGALGW